MDAKESVGETAGVKAAVKDFEQAERETTKNFNKRHAVAEKIGLRVLRGLLAANNSTQRIWRLGRGARMPPETGARSVHGSEWTPERGREVGWRRPRCQLLGRRWRRG